MSPIGYCPESALAFATMFETQPDDQEGDLNVI